MNAKTHAVPVCDESYRSYASASRRLRRKFPDAPSPIELIQFELRDRDPADIASSYLDYRRDAERRRQFAVKPPTRLRPLRPISRRLQEGSLLAGDPSRN